MDLFTNWDDLVHGTAVFSAAVPFLLAIILCWKVPEKFWWAVLAVAALPAAYWLFGLPNFPPTGSEDVTGSVLLTASALLLLDCRLPRLASGLLRLAVFLAIGFSLYPAWLSADGGWTRKLLVTGGFGATVAGFSLLVEALVKKETGNTRRFSLTPAAFIPPTIALAVLLQTGGAMRFAQATGALAAGLAAICLAMLIWKKEPGVQGKSAGLWCMITLALAWSGWLFAEIRWGLACLLLCSPLAAMLVGLIPKLPRSNRFLCLMWDFVGAALVAVPVAAVAAIDFAREMAEFEGY